ncbi:MAG TPA: RHS repeat domain-containing protein [Allosphingosinicella sp.]|nr:RHS repeat domain-containing protein [Allosphingosinicella sp.]
MADGHYAIRFAWLVTGELSALQNGSFDRVVTFAYDALGRRTATAAFDGTSSSRSYDAVGRLTGLALDLPSSDMAPRPIGPAGASPRSRPGARLCAGSRISRRRFPVKRSADACRAWSAGASPGSARAVPGATDIM